jgi:CDP-6-deoxy-D-xylo-4-hexulose-3-dehydrase
MTQMRRANLAKFQNLFEGDARFIIQRENGTSSSFCFTIILNPDMDIDRGVVMKALKAEDIGFRIITGGCFPRHDVIKYFDYELVGEMTNGDLAHDRGFFVGNHPFDLGPEIDALYSILDAACK